jgi:ABC-type nitrate/sulfonate/bicarbonate transport system ATPase subunit
MAQFEYKKTDVLLKVENVSLSIGENLVLKDINFEIRDIVRPESTGIKQGQIVGLLAPSGLGKSTLLKILAGIQKPDTGTILIGVDQKPVVVGEVGFVQQNYPLFYNRTVFGNLNRSARIKIKDPKERKERINELLNRFDLIKVSEHYPAELSGGQRQRAAIVQQILSSSHFLLLDEVTSGLDYNTKQKVISVIQEVACLDELNTIILVSHDIESTVSMADTILIMGRDKDVNGTPLAGALMKFEIDLIERDLAWHKEVDKTPAFVNTVNEIKSIFPTL